MSHIFMPGGMQMTGSWSAGGAAQASTKENKITVYTGEGFTGKSAEFKDNVPNLDAYGFNDAISSFKVTGAPWVAYYHGNYIGKQRLFEAGEYSNLEDKRNFSSLRMITEDRKNPEIQLFENTNYEGKSVTLKDEKNLSHVNFNDTASSHKVKSGVWVLYEHWDRQGNQLVCFPGQEVPNYGEIGFNDTASWARPL